MFFDVNVKLEALEEDFLDKLEDIIDDYNIHFFLVNPESEDELSKVVEFAKREQKLYFSIPSTCYVEDILGALGVHLVDKNSYEKIVSTSLPIIIENGLLDRELIERLVRDKREVVVLNAQRMVIEESKFYFTLSQELFIQSDILKNLDIKRVLLSSDYPHNSFDKIEKNIKQISDAIFRPEPTIINNILKNSFKCFEIKYLG